MVKGKNQIVSKVVDVINVTGSVWSAEKNVYWDMKRNPDDVSGRMKEFNSTSSAKCEKTVQRQNRFLDRQGRAPVRVRVLFLCLLPGKCPPAGSICHIIFGDEPAKGRCMVAATCRIVVQ